VTCSGPEHHRIARFTKTIHWGDIQDLAHDLADWTQTEPGIGTLAPNEVFECKTCGNPWWNTFFNLHIGNDEGWRGRHIQIEAEKQTR
jgi:hypothetical protein